MSDENKVADEKRRTVLKGAAATGVAATGLGVFGSASAQQGIKNLNVQVGGDGLVSISNINALNNVQISDVAITVIGGDFVEEVTVEDVLNDPDILNDLNAENVQVVNVEESLNENVVQAAVAVLGDAGELVAAGSDAANV